MADEGPPLVQDPASRAEPRVPPLYLKGLDALNERNWAEALAAFEDFLLKSTTSRYSQVSIYNSAIALEGLQRWGEAVERYRAVIQNTVRAPRLRALSLYRLSFCLEALGEDSQAVAALDDANNRKSDLPAAIASAELPARLAAAYARAGNMKEAMRHYQTAEVGISRLQNQHHIEGRRSEGVPFPEWLPKTLFEMGRAPLASLSWDTFEDGFRPVERAQVFLLRAIELNSPEWSQRASDELVRVYDHAIDVLQARREPSSDEDPIAVTREIQRLRWDRAELIQNSLHELRALRAPAQDSRDLGARAAREVFVRLEAVEKRLSNILSEEPAGNGLTPEAAERRARKTGQGNVSLDSDESLAP